MNVLIVFNHPYIGSYCNALLDATIKGLRSANHQTELIHLDQEGFNPVMNSEDLKGFIGKSISDPKALEYSEKLKRADHLIFIFPIWWELMPALTKGFIDKVMFPGTAFDYTNKARTRMMPLFKNLKGITMITTMNTPKSLYRFLFGNAIKKAVFMGTFWKMGYKNREWISFNQVKQASQSKRESWLIELEKKMARI